MIPELLLAIVSHRVVSAPTVQSLWRYVKESKIPTDLGLFIGDALIGRGRSQAASKFLSSEIPYMIFIDDDIIFTTQDIIKLYESMKSGYDVIGGIYPVRGASQLSSYAFGGHMPMDGKIYEIEYLATGFMGISRRCLQKIKDELKPPWLNPNDWSQCYPFFASGRCLNPQLFDELYTSLGKNTMSKKSLMNTLTRVGVHVRPGSDPIYISEDWDFCETARKVGVKVYADTSIQVGHMREQAFTPQDVQSLQLREHMDKQIYGAMRNQSELMMSVDTDLSEFLHNPVSRIQEFMNTAQSDLAKKWENKAGDTESFYRDNREYLFDLAAFNRTPGYFQDRIAQLVNIRGQKILDIGCGIGTLVFAMAEEGNRVVGWDINQTCINFCRFKKKKYKLGGGFVTKQPDYGQFDLITAIDVLEHIDTLEEFIYNLGKGMKQGAKFYHSDYFPKGEVWPMHFEENGKHLSKWLKKAGIIEWDGRWGIRG